MAPLQLLAIGLLDSRNGRGLKLLLLMLPLLLLRCLVKVPLLGWDRAYPRLLLLLLLLKGQLLLLLLLLSHLQLTLMRCPDTYSSGHRLLDHV